LNRLHGIMEKNPAIGQGIMQARESKKGITMTTLPIGKIDPEILETLLSRYTKKDERVRIGAGIGEDAAVIDMGPVLLVAKTDPITHASSEIGRYAVHINANDIAAMGGTPKWYLATILMPEGSKSGDLDLIFSQVSKICEEIGVVYCGGHTEVTHSVNHPVVIGQMLGEVSRENLKPSSGAMDGDELIMTKTAALEATAIIALEKEEELGEYYPDDFIRRAQRYLHDPGISVLKEASLVSGIAGVHALHDPTEGGISTAVSEMAKASNLGVVVYGDRIPVTEETKALCNHYGINPLGAFASGSLLMAVSPRDTRRILDILTAANVQASCIGKMVKKKEGLSLLESGGRLPLPVFHQDELSKLFG
jgi:hydrogenase expression/formation protein HypE